QSLLIALADEGASNLLAHIRCESLFDELLRRVAGAETGNGRLLAQFLELLRQLAFDPLFRDLHGHFFGCWTSILDFDCVFERLFLLRRLLGNNSGILLGHGTPSLWCTPDAPLPAASWKKRRKNGRSLARDWGIVVAGRGNAKRPRFGINV